MHFDLTDEQKALRDMLDSFLAERLGGAKAVDATRDTALDRDLWSALAALGLGGTLVPEADGGLGLDLLTLAVAAETLGGHAAPAPVVPNALAAWLIAETGTTAQRERWLTALISGECTAAFALQEEDGWFEQAWTLQPHRLEGAKRNVERGGEVDLLILGILGGGLALAERDSVSDIVALDTLDRSRPLADVHFAGGKADILPAEPSVVGALLNALAVVHAADALGAAAAVHALAVQYAGESYQFGRPIGSFQALKHQLAEMSVEIEPARPLVWYAAHAWDTKRPDAGRMASLAKAHAGELAVAVGRGAIEAHGGIGYTWEYPAHLFLKRAMHDRAWLGGTACHRERVAQLGGWGARNG